MTTTSMMPLPKQQFLSAAGIPLVGGLVYTYAAGTTNKKATYTDQAGTVQQPNPIPLNLRGEPDNPIYWTGNYRVDVRDLLGNLVYSVDNFNADPLGIARLFAAGGSSLVGFVRGDGSATPRWVQDKLREIPSVRDYGADPALDDNTAAFQAAIDAVSGSGGGAILIDAQTYKFKGTIYLKSYVELVGSGAGVTVLQQNNTAVALIKSYQFDTLTGTSNNGGIRRAALRGLTLQGTLSGAVPAGGVAQHGVAIYGYGCLLENVHSRYFGGIGIYTEWATPGTSPDTGYYDGFVENRHLYVKAYMNGLSGIKCAGPNDGQWLCPIAFDNNLNDTSADKANVWITSKGNPQHIDQLHAWGNSSGTGLLLEGSAHLANSQVEGATVVQVKIKTGEITFRGGMIFAAGSTNSIGLQFVGGTGVCIGYDIDTAIENCNGGSIDFGTGIDSQKMNIRAYQTAGTPMLGTIPTAGVGKSFKVQFGGGANNRATVQREYSLTATNLSTTDFQDKGLEYASHGGEGVLALPQRKTEPAAAYVPSSGLVMCGRENALKVWQMSGHVGAIGGEPLGLTVPADNLDFTNYQLITLTNTASDVVINNFKGGLNGSPMFLEMGSGGGNVTLSNSAGNIRSKTGADITRVGLGPNRMLGFVKAKDGNYYQI